MTTDADDLTEQDDDLELRAWARSLFAPATAEPEPDDDAPKPARDLLISNDPPRTGLFA